MSPGDLSQFSMLDLFRMEADAQAEVLTSGLLALERGSSPDQLELCMRAAHSLKGAAQIVGLEVGVKVTHAMEDCLVAAQEGRITLGQRHIDRLLKATDLLVSIAHTEQGALDACADDGPSGVRACLAELALLGQSAPAIDPATAAAAAGEVPGLAAPPAVAVLDERRTTPERRAVPEGTRDTSADRTLRVTAQSLNRLLALAGESLVESRNVKPFADSLLRLKRMQHESCRVLDRLRDALPAAALDEQTTHLLNQAQQTSKACQQLLSQRLEELETIDRRSLHLSHRLYEEALACRMRPFADGVQAYPRLVRDVSQTLGKQVRLEIIGESTQIDRDVLPRLDAPLGHLLRNAIDHGIESPADRQAAGKPPEGVIRLEARHSAGALHVSISDDGGGVDIEKVRAAVVARHLLNHDAAGKLSDAEVFEFLFLPGFSMKSAVSEISGRGVGLDVVQDMVKQVYGVVRVTSQPGKGTRFLLQLPVTQSVIRTLLAEVGGEPYAFPLAYIARTLKLPKEQVELLEGRQHFEFEGRRVGLATAHQVLGVDEPLAGAAELRVIVLGEPIHQYGLVVDRFIGERELVVQKLDPQLGKIKDIAAGALMEDGSPVLIVDPEDLIRSIDRLVIDGRLNRVIGRDLAREEKKRKRVLVVDDSLTVRELERKLLRSHGYEVEVAVDGMDGWNVARAGDFDLVVTDIDMPRMDGIELVTRINADPRLKSRPVMIVSYKDREEDRRRGLDAGAAYYLTKGSFHDETLLQAVVDLIGEPAP